MTSGSQLSEKEETMTGRTGFLLAIAFGLAAAVSSVGPAEAFEDGMPGWQALSTAELEAARAKGVDDDYEDVSTVSQTASGNTIVAIGGMSRNVIDDTAFSGAAGIITVMQNNGHGATISNVMTLDLTIHTAPMP